MQKSRGSFYFKIITTKEKKKIYYFRRIITAILSQVPYFCRICKRMKPILLLFINVIFIKFYDTLWNLLLIEKLWSYLILFSISLRHSTYDNKFWVLHRICPLFLSIYCKFSYLFIIIRAHWNWRFKSNTKNSLNEYFRCITIYRRKPCGYRLNNNTCLTYMTTIRIISPIIHATVSIYKIVHSPLRFTCTLIKCFVNS